MKTLHKINIEIERAGMIMSQFTVTIQYGIVFLHWVQSSFVCGSNWSQNGHGVNSSSISLLSGFLQAYSEEHYFCNNY